MADKSEPSFSFETVAVLVSAILANGSSIGVGTYETMSALDGKRSANAFSHQFRSVIRRARELREQQAAGGLQPATPKSRARADTKKGTARVVKNKKRGKEEVMDEKDDDVQSGSKKRVKTEEQDAFDDGLPEEDMPEQDE